MFTHARPLAVLLFSFALTACADDGLGPMSAGVDRQTCSASIAPAVFSYEVSGDVMTVTSDGRTDQITRVGTGTGRAGHWLVNEGSMEIGARVVDLRLTMKVDVDSVTYSLTCTDRIGNRRGVALVTAAARVTHDTVAILESKESVVPY